MLELDFVMFFIPNDCVCFLKHRVMIIIYLMLRISNKA